MPKHGRGTLGFLRALAGLLVGLVIFCIAVPGAAAGAAARTADPTPASTSTARQLPISLHLGGLDISVVLPLTLNGLLGKTPAPTSGPPTSTPPSSTPPTASSTSHPPVRTTHVDASAPTSRAAYPPRPPAHGGSTATRTTAPRSTTPAPSKSPTKHHQSGGLVFVKELVPASGSMLLIALCAACALGVVAVLKLNGRSTHKR
jgi:hypothetical protein